MHLGRTTCRENASSGPVVSDLVGWSRADLDAEIISISAEPLDANGGTLHRTPVEKQFVTYTDNAIIIIIIIIIVSDVAKANSCLAGIFLTVGA